MQRLSYGGTHTDVRTRTERRKPSDPRYGSRRWKALSARVRRRDGLCRVVVGCRRPAQVADHVFPVYEGMPDTEFYDERYLRGACYYHNTLRGQADKAARELGDAPSSFSGTPRNERPLAVSFTHGSPPYNRDYTQGRRGR